MLTYADVCREERDLVAFELRELHAQSQVWKQARGRPRATYQVLSQTSMLSYLSFSVRTACGVASVEAGVAESRACFNTCNSASAQPLSATKIFVCESLDREIFRPSGDSAD